MEKESAILTDLLGRIRCGEWEVGGRLPPERQLAGMLGTSRPTVRGALRVLQARGMVEVRRGSGCYLRSRRERGGLFRPLREFGKCERHAGIGRLKGLVVLRDDRGHVERRFYVGDG